MDSNESRKLPPSSSNFPSLTQAPGRVCGACAASAFNSKYDLLASATVGNVNSRPVMRRKFKAGDRVIWNSEAGHVSGTIIKVHTEDINYKGYTYHASAGHIAMHKGHALRR